MVNPLAVAELTHCRCQFMMIQFRRTWKASKCMEFGIPPEFVYWLKLINLRAEVSQGSLWNLSYLQISPRFSPRKFHVARAATKMRKNKRFCVNIYGKSQSSLRQPCMRSISSHHRIMYEKSQFTLKLSHLRSLIIHTHIQIQRISSANIMSLS